jgi:hypothetical protein
MQMVICVHPKVIAINSHNSCNLCHTVFAYEKIFSDSDNFTYCF